MIINTNTYEEVNKYRNLHKDGREITEDDIKENIEITKTKIMASKLFVVGGLIFFMVLIYMFFYIGSECVNYIL
mgnify:FL=1